MKWLNNLRRKVRKARLAKIVLYGLERQMPFMFDTMLAMANHTNNHKAFDKLLSELLKHIPNPEQYDLGLAKALSYAEYQRRGELWR